MAERYGEPLVGRVYRVILAVATVIAVGAVFGSAAAAADDPATILLDGAGPGFQREHDTPGAQGTITRTFRHRNGELQLTIVPVSPDVDVRDLFGLFAKVSIGLQAVEVNGLPLAKWFITPGASPQSAANALVVFASRHAIFSALLVTDGTSGLRAVPTLLALATRQIERAGGPPPSTPRRAAGPDEAALTKLLPASPSSRFGLVDSATISGTDELPPEVGIDHEVISFLNDHAHTVVRTYATPNGLTAAVGITKYPYAIFAAAALRASRDLGNLHPVRLQALGAAPDVFTFAGDGTKAGQIGSSFRRGPYSVTVLAAGANAADLGPAADLVADLTTQTLRTLPAGSGSPYRFPSPPSTLAGLALISLFITGAALSSIGVGRARAWTLARSGQAADPSLPPPRPPTPAPAHASLAASTNIIPLDEDARRLRHRGVTVVIAQLVAINVIVVALAGDFGWTGVAVAVLGLVFGLAFTSWWRRRELGTFGPDAPRRRLVLPRLGGLALGVVAIAVLGLGVGYALKGLRYLVFRPTLAQLKWSDRLGLTPRGVGVAFALGGVAVAALGGVLFRLARAVGRAGTRRLLSVDRRPPILYLRSFGDDSLPLATIASARRPFFELFSFRGRDPFEEAVAWELTTYGPVVAVGRPGHTLASLGAAREHLSNDTWQAEVAARMAEARALTVATGETPGLHWEVSQLVSAGHLSKTVFLFPPTTADVLQRRWAFTAGALTAAGARVGPLPIERGLVHTAQIAEDGSITVTVAQRRDEASYRTAVDRAMARLSTMPYPAPVIGRVG